MALKKPGSVRNGTEKINVKPDSVLDMLADQSPHTRRIAARAAFNFPDLVDNFIEHLSHETSFEVREALLYSLQRIGTAKVVEGLLPLLSSEEASLRNSVIEILQEIPHEMENHIIELLNNPDSDIRIFAIDILQQLRHEKAPTWLLSVLKDEEHINVVAAAIDKLAEIGTPEMIATIKVVNAKFEGEAYLQFACATAIERISLSAEDTSTFYDE